MLSFLDISRKNKKMTFFEKKLISKLVMCPCGTDGRTLALRSDGREFESHIKRHNLSIFLFFYYHFAVVLKVFICSVHSIEFYFYSFFFFEIFVTRDFIYFLGFDIMI